MKTTNENLVNSSSQNENSINTVDSLFERLDKKQKLEIRDYIWNWVFCDLEQVIHDMTESDSFWDYMEVQFPSIKEDEIFKEIDKYDFELKMKTKTIKNNGFWESKI